MATKTEGITVGMRELDRLKTVQAVVDGNLKPGLAAKPLAATASRRAGGDRRRARKPSGRWTAMTWPRHWSNFKSEKPRNLQGLRLRKTSLMNDSADISTWLPSGHFNLALTWTWTVEAVSAKYRCHPPAR